MATRPILANFSNLSDQDAGAKASRNSVLRPEEAIRHLAADLDKVSSVVVQTEALGWKMVELSQSLTQMQPAMTHAAGQLEGSNRKMSETSDRVLAAVEIMEMAQRQSMESLNRRVRTLVGLVYWALGLASCVAAGEIIGLAVYFSRH